MIKAVNSFAFRNMENTPSILAYSILSWINSQLRCITESHLKQKHLLKGKTKTKTNHPLYGDIRGNAQKPPTGQPRAQVCKLFSSPGKALTAPLRDLLPSSQRRPQTSQELLPGAGNNQLWTEPLPAALPQGTFQQHIKSSCRASNTGPKMPWPHDTTHWSNTNLLPLQVCQTNYQVNWLPPSFLQDQVLSVPKKLA